MGQTPEETLQKEPRSEVSVREGPTATSLLLGRAECISKGLVFAQFALIPPFDYVAKVNGVHFSFSLITQCHW